MTFALGSASKTHLIGVHPILRGVVLRAIEISEQDFGVYERVRTLDRQRKLPASGASKTLDSMHIPRRDVTGKSSDQLGHAVDLVPWIDGQFRWEWEPCFRIAAAVDRAATEQNVAQLICWGGVWDRWLSQYGGTADNMRVEVAAYGARSGVPRRTWRHALYPDCPRGGFSASQGIPLGCNDTPLAREVFGRFDLLEVPVTYTVGTNHGAGQRAGELIVRNCP
jgi:peptidoglycan L-alanyl-D-glutamate endopeptidase CwlK